MPLKLYNPAADGIAAIKWELHRRNADFQHDATNAAKDADERGGLLGPWFSGVAIGRVVSLGVGVLDVAWPDLPTEMREALVMAAAEELPSVVAGPMPSERLMALVAQHLYIGDEVEDVIENGKVVRKLVPVFEKEDHAAMARYAYDFIAALIKHNATPHLVPKAVRTRSHRTILAEQAAAAVPQAAGTAQVDDPTGAALGTAARWGVFLFYEWALELSGDADAALAATTVRVRGRDLLEIAGFDTDAYWLDWMNRRADDEIFKEVLQDRRSEIRRDIESIGKLIADIYPLPQV